MFIPSNCPTSGLPKVFKERSSVLTNRNSQQEAFQCPQVSLKLYIIQVYVQSLSRKNVDHVIRVSMLDSCPIS